MIEYKHRYTTFAALRRIKSHTYVYSNTKCNRYNYKYDIHMYIEKHDLIL